MMVTERVIDQNAKAMKFGGGKIHANVLSGYLHRWYTMVVTTFWSWHKSYLESILYILSRFGVVLCYTWSMYVLGYVGDSSAIWDVELCKCVRILAIDGDLHTVQLSSYFDTR